MTPIESLASAGWYDLAGVAVDWPLAGVQDFTTEETESIENGEQPEDIALHCFLRAL